MRAWAILIALLGSGFGEPPGRELEAPPNEPVGRLAHNPYFDPLAVPPTVTWGVVPYGPAEPRREGARASALRALAPSPYDDAPPTDLAPSPYGPMAQLAPNPYDGHTVPFASVPYAPFGWQQDVTGFSTGAALAPSPYDVAPPADLAPDPY